MRKIKDKDESQKTNSQTNTTMVGIDSVTKSTSRQHHNTTQHNIKQTNKQRNKNQTENYTQNTHSKNDQH